MDGDYELLKVLGLIDDEETEIVDGDDKFEADEDEMTMMMTDGVI